MIKVWADLLQRMTFKETQEDLEMLLADIRRPSGYPRILSFLNVQGFMLASRDVRFRDAILDSNYILRDGVGARLLCKTAGIDPGLNLNGTDLIPELVYGFKRNITLAIMGTCEPALSSAKEKFLKAGFERVEFTDGFQSEEFYVDFVRKNKPALAILAMGMPKQEYIAKRLKDELDHDMLIVNGGAIIDYMSGAVTRAPLFMCRLGLEWLYRLLRYPRRMWRRNFMTIKFLFVLFRDRNKLRAFMN